MSPDTSLSKIVERQMRNWEIARQQSFEHVQAKSEKTVAPFVTVSRAVGCDGDRVAHDLAERLDWPLFDREILRHMSENDQVRKRLYEKMDQHDTSWIEHAMRNLLQGEYRREDYFTRLSETVLTLARQGPGVFLGRGVDFLLPQDRGLRVRLLAPYNQRLDAYAKKHNCDMDTAKTAITREEHERETLFAQHFGKSNQDQTRFDLLINLGRFSSQEAIEVILTALRQRGVEAK